MQVVVPEGEVDSAINNIYSQATLGCLFVFGMHVEAWVAGHAKVVLKSNFCGIFNLLICATHTLQSPAAVMGPIV